MSNDQGLVWFAALSVSFSINFSLGENTNSNTNRAVPLHSTCHKVRLERGSRQELVKSQAA